MPDHEQFEELCALAAGGALGHHDLLVLKAHLEECYPCRSLLSELSDIHAQWLPTAGKLEVECDPATEAALRMRILKRASKVGTHISRRAHRAAEVPSFKAYRRSAPIWILATAAMAAIMIWGSVQFARLYADRNVVLAVNTPRPFIGVGALRETPVDKSSERREHQLQQVIDSIEKRRAELEAALDYERQQADALRSSNARSLEKIAALNQELEDTGNRYAIAESQLAQLRANAATMDAVTIAQQSEIERLNQQLSEQAATIDQEQQMLASGRSIRDLIAARNLHIIDVYDTDSHGKSSPAFGRVFYTEGRSLIFYAYNLGDSRRKKGEIAFYVWGKQDEAPQNIRKLGALVEDDNAQRRWVFSLTDPKVLAEIDSVFVTLEPGNRVEKHPHGKRFLSAFLGSPANHP